LARIIGHARFKFGLALLIVFGGIRWSEAAEPAVPSEAERLWEQIVPFFEPPSELAGETGDYRSPLRFDDGRKVSNAEDWRKRRREILENWHGIMGPWPEVIKQPEMEIVETVSRESYRQHKVRLEIAPGLMEDAYLLVPEGNGPFPGVVVPYYDAETGAGLGKELRDFGMQLTRRGFVSLSIRAPGGSARDPELGKAKCQPLSYLAYVAANSYHALANRPDVDPDRIGIAGHSYGGKWAMFASCLYEAFACAAWSDPGIVFDESRGNVNYWDRWYLGAEPGRQRPPEIPDGENPGAGADGEVVESGDDLHELHALMAPRPFLVSGGAEDPPARWRALNHTVAVNRLLGYRHRVAMTNREGHSPTPESNEQIYRFFEYYLKAGR
jgi:hypothetical protein